MVHYLLDDHRLLYFDYLLNDHLHLDYFGHLDSPLHYLLNYFWYLHDFLIYFLDFYDFLHNSVNVFDDLNWNIDNFFNLLHPSIGDQFFNYFLDWHHHWDLNHSLNNLLDYPWHLDNLVVDLEASQNIFNIDTILNFLVYHGDHRLV